MKATGVKNEARNIVEEMTDDASWDDLMYRIYARRAIEDGLADSVAERTLDVSDVRREFGLEP